MPLVFEYEENIIIIYFTVKNLILLFAEVLCTEPYNIREIAIIELRQKWVKKKIYFFIVIDVWLIFAVTYS